ncbi:MAG: tyrosine-type recombinase/integrase [Deltaproteobacteria bacterium]|nr:tyrosine-type recombinase/integrase [Deltaproteobacteria bacterium]
MAWYRDFKSQLKRAGLRTTSRAHDLRHTAATYVINNGGTTKDAAVMLAHNRPAIPSVMPAGLESSGSGGLPD